jgi:hypothetical protein
MTMDWQLLIGTLAIALFSFFLLDFIKPGLDLNEPPSIPSKIPVIGHIIGLVRDGIHYYGKSG